MKWSGEDEVFIEEKMSNFLQFFCKKTNKKVIYPLGGICKKITNTPSNGYNSCWGWYGGFLQKNLQNPPPLPPTAIIAIGAGRAGLAQGTGPRQGTTWPGRGPPLADPAQVWPWSFVGRTVPGPPRVVPLRVAGPTHLTPLILIMLLQGPYAMKNSWVYYLWDPWRKYHNIVVQVSFFSCCK